MFRNDQRRADAARARVAPTVGHVGRNLGDQPYIMDLVYQSHFAGRVFPSFDPPWSTPQTTGTGSVAAVNPGGGPTAWRISSGATSSSTVYLDWAAAADSTLLSGFDRDATMRSRVRFSTVDANADVFVGFATSTGLATTVDGLFFGIDGSVSSDYFVCVARNAGIATTAILDGGGGKASIADDTLWHDVAIVCDSTAAAVRFYVDGQLAATITTDLPSDAGDYFTPHYSAQNGATATARYIDVDVVVLAESAP